MLSPMQRVRRTVRIVVFAKYNTVVRHRYSYDSSTLANTLLRGFLGANLVWS